MGMIGRKAHVARLKRLNGLALDKALVKALLKAGSDIVVDAQISITAGTTSGKGHKPSQPGEPPNQDTGVLGNNIEVQVTSSVQPVTVEVSSNAPYSAALELGTSRMAARPFMAPARDRNRGNAEKLVKAAVDHVSRSTQRAR